MIERKLPTGEVQHYRYNLNDQLIEANITKANGRTETWRYAYDPLGRRIDKRSKNGKNLHTEFVWDGSHLIQEHNEQGQFTYIYTHLNSYEPLAQINENGEVYYYHCDQIGAPRELTDPEGQLLWHASYKGWGELQGEHNLKGVHQPLRLQNQYADKETGLHYNFFRYYEPTVGRFITQDPIGLAGGENLYRFADNTQDWFDPLGLRGGLFKIFKNKKNKSDPKNDKDNSDEPKPNQQSNKEDRQLWKVKNYDMVCEGRLNGTNVKYFRDPKTELWWSEDVTGHGGSAWKVMEQKSGKLVHYRDADKFGDFMTGKHKGETGKVMNMKDLQCSKVKLKGK